MKKFYKIIEDKIKHVLNKCGYEDNDIIVYESSYKDLADYQYNGVMNLSKIYHQKPLDIANKILPILQKDNFFESVNIAGPGFINMKINNKSLVEFTNINDYTYPKNNKLIFLDYGGANVAKCLHVGHLRSVNIGESLNRLCKYLGYNTISDTHLGDWGRPLGLVILEIYKRNPKLNFFDSNYQGPYSKIKLTNADLEQIYPYASNKAKEDEEYLKEAQQMTKRLQNKEKGIIELWKQIIQVSKTDVKKIYNRLNANFDLIKGESDEDKYVPELINYLAKLNIVEDSIGAKVINVSEPNDKIQIPPMILLKSDGGYLYSTIELATIYDRINNYNPEEIWYIADKRQELHFIQVFRAAKKANITKNTKLLFAGFGTVNGKNGKPFKTREGGIMRLNDLLSMVKEESLTRLNPNILEDRDKISEMIAISAVKYADMLSNRESDYIFDIEKFCDLNGKTGPFILYSTIRMKSLLNKAQELNIEYNKIYDIYSEYDKDIIINLNNLDLILNKSFNAKSLNEITDYLFKLSSSYNRFYTENIVLKEKDILKKKSWLYLTKLVYETNIKLLDILAIKVPDKM